MLVTPYFCVALSARSETKRYSVFSRQVSISKPAASIAVAVAVALHRAADARGPQRGVAGRRPRAAAARVTMSASASRPPGPQRAGGGGEHGGLVG